MNIFLHWVHFTKVCILWWDISTLKVLLLLYVSGAQKVIRKCRWQGRLSLHLSLFNMLTSLFQISLPFPPLIRKAKSRDPRHTFKILKWKLAFSYIYHALLSFLFSGSNSPSFKNVCLILPFCSLKSLKACISSELMLGWTLNLHVSWHRAETNSLIRENCILCGIELKQLIKYLIISQQNTVIKLLTNNGKESPVTQATEDSKTQKAA